MRTMKMCISHFLGLVELPLCFGSKLCNQSRLDLIWDDLLTSILNQVGTVK